MGAAPAFREADTLERLFTAHRRVVDEYPDLPMSVFLSLLGVGLWGYGEAKGDPLTIKELSDKVGLPYTTVSRHLKYLGEWERPSIKGLDLVETAEWVLDRRQKTVRLTPKGRRLLDQIALFIDPDILLERRKSRD